MIPEPVVVQNAVMDSSGETFLHKGTNDRWRDVLTESELARYDAAVAKFLSPEQASWLERGSLAVGRRPDERRAMRGSR